MGRSASGRWDSDRSQRKAAMLILLVALVAVVYWFALRRWFSRWGATAAELAEPIGGGGLSGANYSAMLPVMRIMESAAFLMTRKMLGLRSRAERTSWDEVARFTRAAWAADVSFTSFSIAKSVTSAL